MDQQRQWITALQINGSQNHGTLDPLSLWITARQVRGNIETLDHQRSNYRALDQHSLYYRFYDIILAIKPIQYFELQYKLWI